MDYEDFVRRSGKMECFFPEHLRKKVVAACADAKRVNGYAVAAACTMAVAFVVFLSLFLTARHGGIESGESSLKIENTAYLPEDGAQMKERIEKYLRLKSCYYEKD